MYTTTFINANTSDYNEAQLKDIGIQNLESYLEDFRFWMANGTDEKLEDGNGSNFNEYALCFDFVEANTFSDQPQGYFRYQLCWGGPSAEFRFFHDGTIQFVFLDWFVGIGFDVTDAPEAKWLASLFDELGSMNWSDKSLDEIGDDDHE